MTMSFYSAWQKCQEPVITQWLLRKECEPCSILSRIYICTHHSNGYCADFRYNRIRWPINFFFKKNLYTNFCNILWSRFLFVIAPNLTTMYSNKWWVKETVIHPWILEFCSAIKKNRLSVLSTALIYVSGIMLSEKEPGSKGHIGCDSFYLTFSKWQNHPDEDRLVAGRSREGGETGGAGRLRGAAREGDLGGVWRLWQSGSDPDYPGGHTGLLLTCQDWYTHTASGAPIQKSWFDAML